MIFKSEYLLSGFVCRSPYQQRERFSLWTSSVLYLSWVRHGKAWLPKYCAKVEKKRKNPRKFIGNKSYLIWIVREVTNTHFFVCTFSVMDVVLVWWALRSVITFYDHFISGTNRFFWIESTSTHTSNCWLGVFSEWYAIYFCQDFKRFYVFILQSIIT